MGKKRRQVNIKFEYIPNSEVGNKLAKFYDILLANSHCTKPSLIIEAKELKIKSSVFD